MALPPFPPFPAAFGPMGAGAAALYRGQGAGPAAAAAGGPRGAAMRGAAMQRAYENGEYRVLTRINEAKF